MNLSLYGRFGLVLALLTALAACQRVDPTPPRAEGFDAPLSVTTSYVAGSLAFQLQNLEDKINRELDPVLVGKSTPGEQQGGLFPFRVARSGRVQVRYTAGQIRLATPLQLWIGTPFGGGQSPADKPFCSLSVRFQSPVTVTPNWRLASHIQFSGYDWLVKPSLRLLGKEIDLTDLAQRLLNRYQSAIESAIDAAIYDELQLDKTVAPIWRDIQKPLLIDRQFGLWLVPRALAVASSPISGDQGTIISRLGITFETRTVLNDQPPTYTPTPLPALQKRDTLPQVSDLRLLSSIPYADINRVLAKMLADEPRKLAMGTLTIKKVTVYGGQRTLIARTDVSGLLDGTVYLRGRPEFDTTTNTLILRDLDFDAGTSDALSWLSNSLVHRGMIRALSSLLTIPLGDDIALFPQKISQAFAKGEAAKKTAMHLKTFQFVPQQVAILPDGIQALIRVRSEVAVEVKDL